MDEKNRPLKKNKKNLSPGKSQERSSETAHRPRTTVDDPQNDVFDDEIYDEDSVEPKASPKEEETFEKPW